MPKSRKTSENEGHHVNSIMMEFTIKTLKKNVKYNIPTSYFLNVVKKAVVPEIEE